MQTLPDDLIADPPTRPARKPRLLNGTQIMFAVIVAIALMLAINFSSRVTADRELQRVRDAVDEEIETLRREQRELLERLEFVQSEAFIEQWARSEGRMVREGEVLLVLFPPAAPEVEPASATVHVDAPPLPGASPSPAPAWHSWWALFFDAPPPGY